MKTLVFDFFLISNSREIACIDLTLTLDQTTCLEVFIRTAYADDILSVAHITRFVSVKIKNSVGKGENASYHHNVFKGFYNRPQHFRGVHLQTTS